MVTILKLKCNIIQIVTGIEVNGEVYFPRLREYGPSAEQVAQTKEEEQDE